MVILLSLSLDGRVAAQTTSPGQWLSKLADAFQKDIEEGDIESAALHRVQLQSAVLVAANPHDADATQMQRLRDELIDRMGKQQEDIVSRNPSAIAPLLADILALQSEIRKQDWEEAERTILNMASPLQKVLDEGKAKQSTEPDPHEMVALMAKVEDALKTDDVFTAEINAPKLLRFTQQHCEPVSHFTCYQHGYYPAYDALGRGAFLRGDDEAAKQYFLRSAQLPRGHVFLVRGPSLKLADELIAKGYASEVIRFLEESKSFWDAPYQDKWIAGIREGKRPNFRPYY